MVQLFVSIVFTVKAIRRPKSGYPVMATSMIFYFLAFIPLVILTITNSNRIEMEQKEFNKLIATENFMRMLHNCLLAISSALYVAVVVMLIFLKQRILKVMNPKAHSLTTHSMLLSVFLWCLLCFGGLIAIPLAFRTSTAIWAGSAWAFYVVTTDFVIMDKIICLLKPQCLEYYTKTRKERLRIEWAHWFVRIGSILIIVLVIVMFLAGTMFSKNIEMQRLFYRIAFCCSPLWHVNHLVFTLLCEMLFDFPAKCITKT